MDTEGNGLGERITEGQKAQKCQAGIRQGHALGQVRGVLAEQIVVSTTLDPFLSLRALAAYSGLSVRKLREYLDDPAHPLPCYRVGGKILVRRSEFDQWIASYRQLGRAEVHAIVADVLDRLTRPA